MSIKEQSKRASTDSQIRERQGRRVVPETTIRDFIGSLGIQDVCDAASRFQIVADITSNSFQRRINQLDASALRLLQQMSRESNNKHYRRIMRAIMAAVAQGAHGINNAHLTANQVVEFAFRCTADYAAALRSYRGTLRNMRRPIPNIRVTTAGVSASEKPVRAIP